MNSIQDIRVLESRITNIVAGYFKEMYNKDEILTNEHRSSKDCDKILEIIYNWFFGSLF